MRKHINRLQAAFLLLSLLALTACGGGGGSSPVDGGGTVGGGGGAGGSDDGVSASTSDIVLTDENGATISSISFLDGATVSFTVNDSDGNPVDSGNTGSYDFSVSGVTDEGGFATGANGAVNFDLSVPDPTVSGTGVLTITLDTPDGEVSSVFPVNVELVAGVPAIVNLVLRNSVTGAETVDIVTGVQSRLFIEVTDGLGNPVADQEVNLSSSNSLITLNASIRTESDGTENVLVTAADVIPDDAELSGEITAIVSIERPDGTDFSLVQTAPFEVVTSGSGGDPVGGPGTDPTPGIPTSLSIELSNSISGEVTTDIRTDQDSNLFVEVLDGLGDPVADVEVQIVTTNDLISFNTSVLTEANGQENILIGAATPDDASSLAGTITVTAIFIDENGASASLVQSSTFEVIAIAIAGEDAVPDRINFVSAAPETIAIQGAGGGGRSETSVITFQVFDASGLAVSDVAVDFTLDSTLGGIELLNATDTTDAFGEVTVTVTSGNQPTQVSVEASFSILGEIRSANSEVLVIEAGPPQQDGFSLATSVFNPGGFSFDGITTELTVSASDAFSNQIPDGTAVLFRTEYGRVDASCVTANGVCTAEWRSQNPRVPLLDSTGSVRTLFNTPCEQFVRNIDGSVSLESTTGSPCSNDSVSEDEDLGQIFGGRTTVLATAFGNEAFIDSNSNGFYDSGEPFEDLPEAFLDDNEDGAFGGVGTVGSCEVSANCPEEGGDEETFIDINVDGNYSGQDGIYNGTNCSDAAEASGDCSKELVTVRAATVIHMGGSVPYGAFFDSADNLYSPAVLDLRDETVGSSDVTFKFTDVFNGHLPEGTTINIEQSFGGGCFVDTDFDDADFTVPNTSDPDVGREYDFSVVRDSTSSEIDVITLGVEIPAASSGGTSTEFEFSLLCVTDPDTDLTAIGAGTDNAIIGLSLTDQAGTPATEVTDVAPGILNINLSDSSGAPVNNVLVSVETTVGEVAGNGTLLVSNGVAEVNILAGSDEGGGLITVTFGNISSTVPFQVVQTGGTGTVGDILPTIGLQLVNAFSGAATREVSSTDDGRVIVTLNDTDGLTALPFELVTVTSNLGNLTPSSGSTVLTDATGIANFELSAGSAEVGTAGTITAVYQFTTNGLTTEITETFNFEIGIGSIPTDLLIELQDGTGATIGAINSTNPGTVVVTVQDIDGLALADQIVNVTTNLGDLSPVSGNILTNALGEAVIDLSVGNASAGEAGTLTATLGSLIVSLPFEIAAEAAAGGEPETIGLVLTDSVSAATTSIASDDPGTLLITVLDDLGAVVSGQTVTVTTSLGALTPASGVVLTDAAGVASIQVLADGEEVGSAGTVTVVAGTVTETTNFEIAASAGGTTDAFTLGLSLADSAGATTTTISSTEPGTLTVTLTDSSGLPTESEIVSVSSNLGLLVPSTGNIRTDEFGQATIDLQAGTAEVGEGGVLTVTYVSAADGTFTETFTFDVVAAGDVAGVPVDLLIDLEDTLGATISSINSNTSGVVVVTVQDFNGDAIADQIVNVASTLGDLSPASGNVLTNGLGEATIELTVGTASAGEAGTLTATLGALRVDLPFEIALDAAVGGEPNTVGLALADSAGTTTTSVAEDDPGTLSITVLDDLGALVAGQAVSVTTSLGALTPASGIVLTDATGVATIQILADGAEVGSAGTLTVVTGAITETTNFEIAASAGGTTDAFTLGLSLTDPGGSDTTTINSAEPGTMTVTLTDSAGAVVSAQVVNLSTTLGVLVPGSGNVLTDGSGEASVQVQVGTADVGEAGTLTATYVDPDSGSSFTETFTFEVASAGAVAGEPSSLTIILEDPDNIGVAVTSISNSDPAQLSITVLDATNAAVEGVIVSVSTTLGEISPASGNVLTDASGIAIVDVLVGSGDPGEAGSLTVTIGDLTETLNFEIVDSGTTSTAGFSIAAILYNSDVDLDLVDLTGDIVDPELVNRVSTVNSVESGIFVVYVEDAITGLPIGDAIVTVTSDVGELTPSNGRILTNSNGIASAVVASGTDDPGAAGTLTATLEDVEATINFSIGNITLSLGFDANGDLAIDLADADEISQIGVGGVTDGTTTLAPTGSTSLSVTVVDDAGAPFTIPLTVNFSSSCSSIDDALIDTGVTTVNGIASATYEATGCAGTDEVTATVVELSGVTARGSLSIADADANSIQFISADPATIALQGTGGTGRQEFSTLIFEVVDEAGNPISGELVTIDLSTTLGGVSLTGDTDDDGDLDNSGTDERLTSNASGQVSVIVNSGTVPTSVRVTASITLASGDVITTVSDSLVVSTGLPDQNSFSLSASLLSPGGFNFEGITSDQAVRAADAFNNPVPDGTTINFTTEYGRIDATCTTSEGDCSSVWNSQDPRGPDFLTTGNVLRVDDIACDSNSDGIADIDSVAATVSAGLPCPILNTVNPDVAAITGNGLTSVLTDPADIDYSGQIFGSRSTVLAYAIGEESFIDANGNGRYDWIDANDDGIYDDGVETLEVFVDLPEAFLDHNGDGVFGGELTTGACTSETTANGLSIAQIAANCGAWQEGGAEEEFIDFNTNSEYDFANGIYNGTLCDEQVEAAGDCTTELVNVRNQLTLLAGGSTPYIGIYGTANVLLSDTSVDVTVTGITTRRFYVSDTFNGRLPSGTTVGVSASNCRILSQTSFEVADSNGFGNHIFDVTVDEDTSTDGITSGFVTLTVTTPDSVGAVAVSSSFSCTDLN